MSGLSPARRLRTKTSDFSEFFRGNSHNASSSRQTLNETQENAGDTLDVPLTTQDSSSSKKFSSKLPFLGRTRKKSNAEEAHAAAARDKHETVPPLHQSLLDGLTGESTKQSASRDKSSQTLGSKFAAHFTPSRPRRLDGPRKSTSSRSVSRPRVSTSESRPSVSLHPPQSYRSPSFESASSGASGNRSTTPRPKQPTITVSAAPTEDLSQYADLFTMPRKSTSNSTAATSSSVSTKRQTDDSTPSQESSANTSPQTSPLMIFPSPPLSDPEQTRQSIDRESLSDSPIRPGSRSSVKSTSKHRRTNSVVKELEDVLGTQVDLSPAEDSENNKERTHIPNHTASADSPRIQTEEKRTSIPQNYLKSLTSPRIRTRSTSSSRPSAPPNIPLPPPPPSTPPNPVLPATPTLQPALSRKSVSSTSSVSSVQSGGISRRIRANTTPASNSSPPMTPPFPSSPSSFTSPSTRYLRSLKHDRATDSEKSDWDRSDWERSDAEGMDNANPDQLRQALTVQKLRYRELLNFVHQLIEKHDVEKSTLEKKVDTLERETARKEKEIKGLRWMLDNSRTPGDQNVSSLLSAGAVTKASSPDTEKTRRRVVPGSHSDNRLTDDSEVESSSSLPIATLRKHRTMIANVSPKLTHSPTSRRLAKGLGFELAAPRLPFAPGTNKRSSISSFSSTSNSSTTSSLFPPSSIAPSTISSNLSSIPETAPSLPPKAGVRGSPFNKDAPQVPRRPSMTPAEAYAANLKHGRPPSIAQVLDQSPTITMEEVLDKLRPFGSDSPTLN